MVIHRLGAPSQTHVYGDKLPLNPFVDCKYYKLMDSRLTVISSSGQTKQNTTYYRVYLVYLQRTFTHRTQCSGGRDWYELGKKNWGNGRRRALMIVGDQTKNKIIGPMTTMIHENDDSGKSVAFSPFSSNCNWVLTYSVGKVMQISMPPVIPPAMMPFRPMAPTPVAAAAPLLFIQGRSKGFLPILLLLLLLLGGWTTCNARSKGLHKLQADSNCYQQFNAD